jgi:hypothetical protein
MTQMTLFDDYGPITTIEKEKKMTWLELYDFLNKNTNGEMSQFWNQTVCVYDVNTGNEYECDTMILDESKLVLSIKED